LRAVLREEVVVTGVEGVVGWLFYNALIGLLRVQLASRRTVRLIGVYPAGHILSAY